MSLHAVSHAVCSWGGYMYIQEVVHQLPTYICIYIYTYIRTYMYIYIHISVSISDIEYEKSDVSYSILRSNIGI